MNTAIMWFVVGALTGANVYPLVAEAWRWWWRPQNVVVDDYIRKHPCFPEDINNKEKTE